MTPVAVRELAEKIDASECLEGRVEYIAAIIAEAVKPLVRMASAVNFCPCDAACGLCENDRAELARWRSE